jgi:hypothetical protein
MPLAEGSFLMLMSNKKANLYELIFTPAAEGQGCLP